MNKGTVYTGVWQNHSQSGWRGSTLTLDIGTASLLISALATFVTLVGTRFWAIVSFVIHQIQASSQSKDGVHHQHQVIYRNGSSPLGTAWLTFQIAWAWRDRARLNIPRFLMAALPPILTFAGFAAASVLSAKVATPSTAASQVKILSKNCGYVNYTTGSIGSVTQDGLKVHIPHYINSATMARNYARSCYDSSSQNLASCNVFPVPKLPYDTLDSAPCPFGGNRCVLGDNGAFLMQTPWLNSHTHFGINAPAHNRIEWRRRSTCSILNVDDRISTHTSTSGTTLQWHLGYNGPLMERANVTHTYAENTANLGIGYTIRPASAIDGEIGPVWIPIPDLAHTDADVSIFYLSQNSVLYPDPVDDPLFSAHRKYEGVPRGTNHTYHASDDLVTVLACIDQSQIRDPKSEIGTPFLGTRRFQNETLFIGLNSAQLATSSRFTAPLIETLMYNSVNSLGTMALKAQDKLYITVSSGLPSDQWKIELKGWFDTALAHTQSKMINFASKDMEEVLPGKLTLMNRDAEVRPMCDNQMIRAVGQYQSFSMMGIEIIIALGVFIVLLSFVLEYIVGFVQTRWGSHAYKQRLWTTDGILQQQRLAFENKNISDWEGMDDAVPVTKQGKIWTSEPLPHK